MSAAVQALEVEVEYKNGQAAKYELRRDGDIVKARLRHCADGTVYRVAEEVACQEVMQLVTLLALSQWDSPRQIEERALEAMGVTRAELEHMEVELTFEDGREVDIEF